MNKSSDSIRDEIIQAWIKCNGETNHSNKDKIVKFANYIIANHVARLRWSYESTMAQMVKPCMSFEEWQKQIDLCIATAPDKYEDYHPKELDNPNEN